MKKYLFLFLFALSAACAWAQTKEAYVLYNAEGKRVEYQEMLKQLAQKDVVFFGEIHTCAIAHWMEFELTKDLYAIHKDKFMIGAEMFERDDQLILNEYLGGLISKDRFYKESKLWDNYETDYSAIVEFAKAHGIAFTATNVARRYANMVAKGGFEALDKISDAAKQYVAPLPIQYKPNKYVDAYFSQMMGMMGGKSMGKPAKKPSGMRMNSADNLSKSQAVKDVTMAYSIAQTLGSKKMIHLNGNFHSTGKCGIIPYLNDFKPGLKIGTIEVVRQSDVSKLDAEALGKADFILCVPESMTSTSHN